MDTTPANLDLLPVFVTVADVGSFTRAAKRLGVTTGTVSRAIARLEAAVGAELLHRTTHRVALSTAGTALYERAAPHVAALVQALGALPERAEQPSGLLRIAAPLDFGVMVLPRALGAFALRYPAVRVDLRVSNTAVDLGAEGGDLAVRASPTRLADSTLSVRRLGAGEIRLYASPSYVARRGEPRSWAEAGHEWVVFTQGEKVLAAPKEFRPRFRVDDFFAVRGLLEAGVGVGPLPSYVAEPSVRAGELVAVGPGLRWRGSGGYFLVYTGRSAPPRKVAAFRDFFVEWVRANPLDRS